MNPLEFASPVSPLNEIDIVLSIYNQEKIIERVLAGVCDCTLTPFHLILVFDGCTDASQRIALDFLHARKPPLMRSLTIQQAPNVYETKANNTGFRLGQSPYLLTLQDDMEILERGWDVRLTYPLRAFRNVLAVTGRAAQDIAGIDARGRLIYRKRAAREHFSLSRDTFALRDVVNRGPIAFDAAKLRALDFLNEAYAPSDLDDADLCLRAFEQHGWLCGAFWIDYVSKPEWSKKKQDDSTMDSSGSESKNARRIMQDHADYLRGPKHSFDARIALTQIDYPAQFDRKALERAIAASQARYIPVRIAELSSRFVRAKVQSAKRFVRRRLA